MSMADRRIVVCGFGAITSLGELGVNQETFWSSLKTGNSGFQSITEHFADLVIDSPLRDIRADRDGFVLGEDAGALVLADAQWAAKNGLIPLAEILGYWENAGAQHMVQPNSQETAHCMKQTIAQANLTPQEIDYVNAHATATSIGDRAESQAIHQVLRSTGVNQDNRPYVNSTKALIGHTCGAAGVIELIVAILSMRDGVIHPMGDYDIDPACLRPGGNLIFPCGTLAHESRIIEAAKELFHKNLRLLSEKLILVTQQLGEAFDQCHDLLEKGWVSLVERREKKYWLLHVYEAQLWHENNLEDNKWHRSIKQSLSK